jgi:tRNA 2-thiouridine synthesizing protein A
MTPIADDTWRLDCLGMLCPVPIIKTGRAIRKVDVGTILEVVADDPGVESDLVDWCDANRQELVSMKTALGVWTTRIRRSR